jgi:hypothetical protein
MGVMVAMSPCYVCGQIFEYSPTRVRRKVAWLDVEEVTRTNRPTGNLVSIPLAAVLGLSVSTIDVPDEPKARPRKARVAPPADEAGLGL